MREGWVYKKLGEVCKTTSGGTPSKAHSEYYEGGTIPWLRSGEVKQGAIFETEMFITEEGLNNSSAKIVPEDSVAVAMYGATVGQVGIIKAPMCTNQAICCILPSKELLPDYLYRFLSSKKEEYLKNAIGGAQPNISQAEIKKTLVSIPPLTTQQQIVSELDLLSHILDQKRQQLKEYDALAESIFYDMFGDPVENPKGWEVKKLEEIGFCCSGGTPSRSNDSFFHGTIDWYSAGELNSLFLGESIEKITEDAVNQSAAKLCKVDSLFIGMYDTAAFKLGIATKECCSNQACANICLNEDNVIWLYYTLQQMREEALKNRRGARQKNLNLGYIKSFRVPLPPLTLQHSFAAKIESIEHQKQLLRSSIKETEMLFQSRMDYWFNG